MRHRRLKSVLSAGVGCVFVALSGCASPSRPTGAATTQKSESAKVDSRLETTESYLVGGRYLILPVSPREKGSRGSISGSYIDGFAWFGLSFSKIYGAYQFVDLVVVDLEKSESFHVFDHPVVLGEWQCSLTRDGAMGEVNGVRSGSREGYGLRFADQLLLPARVDDANGDGRITSKDPSRLYLYDLSARTMRPITPEGYELANLHIDGDTLTVVLEKADAVNAAAVFRYDMKTGVGKLVAERLSGAQ